MRHGHSQGITSTFAKTMGIIETMEKLTLVLYDFYRNFDTYSPFLPLSWRLRTNCSIHWFLLFLVFLCSQKWKHSMHDRTVSFCSCIPNTTNQQTLEFIHDVYRQLIKLSKRIRIDLLNNHSKLLLNDTRDATDSSQLNKLSPLRQMIIHSCGAAMWGPNN